MDQAIRNLLQGATQDARTLLEREVFAQLESIYDILPSGVIAKKPGPHLDATGRLARMKVVEAIQHRIAGGKEPAEAVDDYAREAAFTCLNRFVALKMLEARELVQVCVSKGDQSGGFREFCGLAPGLSDLPDGGYQLYLECLFDELSTEVKVLFDRRDPASLLWPRRPALLRLLETLNHSELTAVWIEDETIGWVYQYFNKSEERKSMREQSSAPRNSRELAVRNQFFTPRYVVQFLSDNTLGRIWYEMRQGNTLLVDKCQYLVRRPDEVFLGSMTSPNVEFPNEDCATMAILLQKGDAQSLSEFSGSDDEAVQKMITLAHCVDGYNRRPLESQETQKWLEQMQATASDVNALTRFSTQELFDFLFVLSRCDRHGGDGSVYRQQWFINATNEIRRRALRSQESGLTQEDLLNQTVFIPYRAPKDPRDLKILDPACGSGHFLLYCFDLLQTIYEETWFTESSQQLGNDKWESGECIEIGLRETRPTLAQAYPTIESLRAAIPGLILGENLHGIDIDSRCAQIAAFALWMRAQRGFNELGVHRYQRLPIRRTNIVVAEPMPGERDLLREVTSDLQPKLLGQLVEVIFDKMKLAGEAGSLLKIEVELADAIASARKLWLSEPTKVQQELFANDTETPLKQLEFDLSGVTDEQFWCDAESLAIGALRKYARGAGTGDGFRKLLFADDAERGFALVDLCHLRYDVVLMNPPFGESPVSIRQLVYSSIPSASQDLFAAFVERWAGMLAVNGRLGALTNRLALFKDLLEDWRRDFLLGQTTELCITADLGYGVLDNAVVEAAAYVIERRNTLEPDSTAMGGFFSLVGVQNKERALRDALVELLAAQCPSIYHQHRVTAFRQIAGSTIPYWASYKWIARFVDFPSSAKQGVIAKKGLETGDDFRFLRLIWEIPSENIAPFARWTPYSKGGEYCPWNDDLHLVFDWQQRDAARRTSNSDLYGRCGITYTERTTSNFAGRVLPASCLFSPAGPGVFYDDDKHLWGLMAFLNSSVVAFYLELMVGGGDTSASGTAARHFSPILLESLPVPDTFRTLLTSLDGYARAIHDALEPFAHEETSMRFRGVAINGRTVTAMATSEFASYERAVLSAICAFREIDQIVFDAYCISTLEIEEMRSYLGRPWPETTTYAPQQVDAIQGIFSDDLNLSSDLTFGEPNTSRAVKKLCHVADARYENWAVRLNVSPESVAESRERLGIIPPSFIARHASRIISLAVGVAFERWNARDVFRFTTTDSSESPFTAFPLSQQCRLQSQSEGILVNDPGHQRDIFQQVRNALTAVWSDDTDNLLREIGEILGGSSDELRSWLCRKFFSIHIAEYSKSRRNAPIYWELATPSYGYSVWLYYHQLTPDTFYKVLNDYVKQKLIHEEQKVARIRTESGENPTRTQAKDLESQERALAELKTFREEIERIAPLWKPDLNDGVIINFAPLWRLVPQNKVWQKQCRECWESLAVGEYDWAHLAMHLWPERVVPKCRDDRGLANAHEVADLLWVKDDDKWRSLDEPTDEVEGQKKRRYLKHHDRLRHEVATLAKDARANLSSSQIWQKLKEGDLDDTAVALSLWPRRVVEKCVVDARLASKLHLAVPKQRTELAVERLIKKYEDIGCGNLATAVGTAFTHRDASFPDVWRLLESGELDDQELALALWPERVVEKCTIDLGLAHQHDLARFFWYEDPWARCWRRRLSPEVEVENEIAHRHKPAVKAALDSLLSAPTPGSGAKGRRKKQ